MRLFSKLDSSITGFQIYSKCCTMYNVFNYTLSILYCKRWTCRRMFKKMKISAISAKKDVRTKMLFCFSFSSCYDYTGWKHQFLDDRLTKDLRWGPFLCWRGRCRLAHSVHWVVRVVCCSFLSSTDVRFQPSTEVLGSSICICPLFKRSVPAIPTVRSSHLQMVRTSNTNGLYQAYKRSVQAI